MRPIYLLSLTVMLVLSGCQNKRNVPSFDSKESTDAPFIWDNANVYFLLTDRFNNGDPSNDVNFERTGETARLRDFMGGDIKGIIKKLNEGYFDSLGITAIWLTPFVEQIHGGVDEGTGFTYGYHGYWAKDWTSLDPNFGTEEDLEQFVKTAHDHRIRVLMDVVINHTGPVTELDPVWPETWVRTGPRCQHTDYYSTITCTLVDNLPDIRTESNEEVELPPHLVEKWKKEGRFENEMRELDAFFERTGYPRLPKYYIIKWLTDYVTRYGIDGYRLDTAKHIEESIWAELGKEARQAFKLWKENNPDLVLDDTDFYMVGEVYGYKISDGRYFHFSDRKVDYFNYDIDALINFEFKDNANLEYEELFSRYDSILNSIEGIGILNYISSHDDAHPFDASRKKTIEAGSKLLLCPGASQIYYGDESGRSLIIEGTAGDATLRSSMNWSDIDLNTTIEGIETDSILRHWQKLGQFRKYHIAVGSGKHRMISADPYLFTRNYSAEGRTDLVVIGLNLEPGKKILNIQGIFPDGSVIKDFYSGKVSTVKDGIITIDSAYNIVLLERI